MKFFFSTLGCRANFAESQFWEELVLKNGGEISKKIEESDFCIANTCTVTDQADKKSRKEIKNILKKNPQIKILITGCANSSIRSQNPFGNNVEIIDRFDLPKKIQDIANSIIEENTYQTSNISQIKTRAFLKVQDGCNNFCTYCVIPQTRGRERSVEAKDVINEINKRVNQGYKEIVLTGIHLSNWGSEYDFKKGDLGDLVEEILKHTTIERIRFGSLEPRYFNDKFIEILNNERVCPHLHLSLQSGSDKILELMHRHYNSAQYYEMVDVLFKKVKDFSLTTDVIVGFPGEDDEIFQESFDFIKKIDFTKIHVFSYSKRGGTLASGMKNQVNEKTKKTRSALLRDLSQMKQLQFLKKMENKTYQILIEEKKGDLVSGLTPNYARVWIDNSESIKRNDIIEVKTKIVTQRGDLVGLQGRFVRRDLGTKGLRDLGT